MKLRRLVAACFFAGLIVSLMIGFCRCDSGSDGTQEGEDVTLTKSETLADAPAMVSDASATETVDASAADHGTAETCGNGTCDKNEDFSNCPEDCSPECGDGLCSEGESPCTCAKDCETESSCCQDKDCPQPLCGPCCNAVCVEGKCEDQWEAPCCWNNICEEGEDLNNCPEDCQPECGDGICSNGEDFCSCPGDCGSEGECCVDADCPQPQCGACCQTACINFQCAEGWLAPCCGNGACEDDESYGDCPEDCAAECGDGSCNGDETPCSCAEDCGVADCCEDEDCPQPKCGPCCHAYCIDYGCVEQWDAPCCWNGECEEGEDFKNCPQDCPAPPETECELAGGLCVGWTPDYSNCPEGTEPTGLGCTTKNEVCCQKDGPPPECDYFSCKSDEDCVKTKAGCCPCSMGGQSTAIAADCVDKWLDSLNCSPDIMCLAVYLCNDSGPACVDGKCTLAGGIEPLPD